MKNRTVVDEAARFFCFCKI